MGDGDNCADRVAYQKIANGFSDVLSLYIAFIKINAFQIHSKVYPQTPTDGKPFSVHLDSVVLTRQYHLQRRGSLKAA